MRTSKIRLSALAFMLTAVAGVCASSAVPRKPAAVSKRPQIKISELMRQLDASGQLDALEPVVKARLVELVPNPVLRNALLASWEEVRRKKDYARLDRFPVVPLKHVDRARSAFGGRGGQTEKVETALMKGRLEDILDECRELAPLPKSVSPQVPMMTDGHFPDSAMGLCDQDRSLKFARILNSLMAANGSEVRVGSVRARSAQKLFEALIQTGHSVELRNERTYANFLSLNWGDQPVIWPVWVDTGLKTKEGDSVTVPVGHSHHAWHIDGPLLKARVMFYLGVSGVGFFAQVDERPAWTGLRAAYRISAANDEAKILKTLDYSGRYYRRIQKESRTFAAGMPADGYGYLGVCNDSNAILEQVNNGTVSVFPLMRAAELDTKSRINDGLDEIIEKFPKDSVEFSRTASNLRRVLSMTPFEDLDDRDLHDEELRKALKSLEAEVGSP